LPIDFGVLLVAAPFAWPLLRSWPSDRRRLVLLWVGLGLAWMYVPVPFQRRFGFGVPPGLAVLAALGVTWLCARCSSRWVRYAVVVITIGTSVLVYVSLIASAVRNDPAQVYLWSHAEADAGAWLGAHASSADVVLASSDYANALVGVIDGRVVHGHIVATLDSDTKKELVRRFFATETSPRERSEVLAQSGATYVALGPRERALGAPDLRSDAELQLVYDRNDVQLFRVVR
jgi:hypothetical protein